jgi:hypothetical protein
MTIAGALESMPEAMTVSDLIEVAAIIVLMVGMSGLGVMIVVRANNRIGWLLTGGSLLFAYQYWAFIREPGPTEQWLSSSLGYMASLMFIPTVILLFPNGRLPSPRWRPVAWLGIGGATAGMLSILFAPTIYDTDVPTPFADVLPGTVLKALEASAILLIPFLLAVVGSLIVRYRRADTLQRLQFKMFAYGAAVALAGSLTSTVIGVGADQMIFGAISVMALPLAIAAAIMRYRLFDIDHLISRTVGYALVVAILALVYVVGAVWLPTQLIGEQSPLFVAGTTLAAASLFNPVRRRVIDRVDHRFNRSRYDAQHVISEFIEGLRDQIDVEQITTDALSVISTTMRPASAGVWVRR